MTYSLPVAVDADTERNVETAYHLIEPINLPSSMRKRLIQHPIVLYSA